ncbi:MAG: hypothetical protein WAR61_12500 [Candidatus Microthrix parvicella]
MGEQPGPLVSWWRRLFGGGSDGLDGTRGVERTRGYPTSGNRASSMHLFWDLPGRFVEVAVTVTILDEPPTHDLYFWALQVSFEDAATGRREGAAHTGPQWASQHPGHGAVNWGGYGARGELDGGPGWLPSAAGNANSIDYLWRVGVPYRLTVSRAPVSTGAADDGQAPGGYPDDWDGYRAGSKHLSGAAAPTGFTAWRATITPLEGSREELNELSEPQSQQPQVIRDLWAPGDLLVSPMVWSEVFARCDADSVRVAWAEPVGIDERGQEHRATSARVNYQAVGDGGCTNTNVVTLVTPDGPAWVQTTNAERTTPQGASLRLADSR